MRPHSLPAESHSFVGMARETAAMPPALLEREKKERKKGKVLHLFRCYTHTHPAGAGSTLKGKRKKKADTDDGQQAETAQGGRGTNGPPEPTYAEKRTWQKQSTHLNPTTHYGEARGEKRKKEKRKKLGTKLWTSWWRVWKTKTINLNKGSAPLNLKVVRCSLAGTVVRSAPGA